MHVEEEVDHLYKLTAQDEDWIKPTKEGVLCWEKDNECFFDSDGEMENWKNRLHDVLALRCLCVTRDFRCISSEVRDLPYDGSGSIKEFLQVFEAVVPKGRRLQVLKLAMHGTFARWWETHEEAFQDWDKCQDMMIL